MKFTILMCAAAATLGAAVGIASTPASAAINPCGNRGNYHAGATSAYNSTVYGARAEIEYNNPDLCGNDSSGVSASVAWSMAHLTDSEYGQELETNPSKPSRVTPLIKDRLVWVVEFHDFTPFVSQPLPDPKAPQTSSETPKANASMLVAVDPATGEVIWGQQF